MYGGERASRARDRERHLAYRLWVVHCRRVSRRNLLALFYWYRSASNRVAGSTHSSLYLERPGSEASDLGDLKKTKWISLGLLLPQHNVLHLKLVIAKPFGLDERCGMP
jgi:hypothetical protein